MARKLRIEYPGAVYHVMSRGDHLEKIFWDEEDRKRFLQCMLEVCGKTGWWLHAYVLMSNHYHFLLETPQPNLVAGMKWLQGTYTQRFNARHHTRGHLFQGRYKALVVDGEDPAYFQVLSTYIHLNPVRAKIIVPGRDDLKDYRWSSFPFYVGLPRRRPQWMRVDRVLGSLGIKADNAQGRRQYEAYLEGRALECRAGKGSRELEEEWKTIRRGWYLGGQSFKDALLEGLDGLWEQRKPSSVSGGAVMAWTEKEAEAWLSKALEVLKLPPTTLAELPKGAVEKQVLAWALRSRTTLSRAWIAQRLGMGHETRVTQAVSIVAIAQKGHLVRLRKKVASIKL